MLNLPFYPYRVDPSNTDYDFVSVGPNGMFNKVARFTLLSDSLHNLAFGDLNNITGEITDYTRSNNADLEKVLSTLAAIIVDFTDAFPGAKIFIMGSSSSRTRLYQIHIGKHWNHISEHFQVLGYNSNNWEVFEAGRNYESFIGWRI